MQPRDVMNERNCGNYGYNREGRRPGGSKRSAFWQIGVLRGIRILSGMEEDFYERDRCVSRFRERGDDRKSFLD